MEYEGPVPGLPTPAIGFNKIQAICVAYEQGVGKGRDAFASNKDIDNPYIDGNAEYIAWSLGYQEGMFQAARAANAAN